MWRFCPLGIVLIIFPIISHGDRVGFTPSPSVVCITDGCVRGVVVPGNFKPYTAWYGIPYAAPPVGSLRFKVRTGKVHLENHLKLSQLILTSPEPFATDSLGSYFGCPNPQTKLCPIGFSDQSNHRK